MSIIIRLQNLPWAANSVDIRRYFAGLSIPEGGVHIVGGEKGDAFIAFSTDEDARQAMEKDGGKIKDMRVKLLLSSRAEMMRVIEQARNQNLTTVQSSTTATAKTSVNDSDRRKMPDHGSSPRRREREKSPSRDRGSRRTSSRRDRSRSRSRSPRKSRDRDRDRDMDRRSDRSKRDDRRFDDSQRSRDERPKNSRDPVQREPLPDKKQTVANNEPPPQSQDKITPPMQGFANSRSFGPMNVPNSQPYDHRHMPSDNNRGGFPFDSRHPGVPVSQHTSFDSRMASLPAAGSPYNFSPSMSSAAHPEKFDSKSMNEPGASVPFGMKNAHSDFHSSVDRRFGPVSEPISGVPTSARERSPLASVAPSEFDKRFGPMNHPSNAFPKGFGIPGPIGPYEKSDMHQTQPRDPMYDKPSVYGNQPFGNMSQYNAPSDRINAPSAPYDRSAISLGQPVASIPPYGQKPAYGTEPPLGYEQIPASNLGSRSTASPGQMNEAGLYGKRLPLNIPTAIPPSAGTFDKTSHPQSNQFDPDFTPPRESVFYSGNSSENPHMSPNVPFGHTAPAINKESLNMPFGRSISDGSRDSPNMPFGRSGVSGNRGNQYDKPAAHPYPMHGETLQPSRDGIFNRSEEAWPKQQPRHADVPRSEPGAWPDERQGLLQPPPLPPAKLGSFNQGVGAPKFFDDGSSKMKGSPQNTGPMKDSFTRMHPDSVLDGRPHPNSMPDGRRPPDSAPESRRTHPDSISDGRRPDLMPDGRRPELMLDGRRPELMPDGRRPELMPDGRRPELMPDGRRPELMPDGRRPELMPDSRRPELMPDGRRLPLDSMPDGRRLPLDSMPDGRRLPPDSMLDGRRPPSDSVPDGRRLPPDSMPDGRRPPPDSMLDGRRPPPDSMPDGRRPPPDSMPDGRRPPPDSMPDGRRPPPDSMSDGRRPPPESLPSDQRPPSDSMADGRPPLDPMPDGRRPLLDSIPDGRRPPPDSVSDGQRPPPDSMSDGRHPPDSMADGRRNPNSIPDGRRPPDPMPNSRRPPDSILGGGPHPDSMHDGRRPHLDSTHDGRRPDRMPDERRPPHPDLIPDGRRPHPDLPDERPHPDSVLDGRRPHPDSMPDRRRVHSDMMPDGRPHPDSVHDRRRAHSDSLDRKHLPDSFPSNKRPHPDSFLDRGPQGDAFPDRRPHPNAFPEGRRPHPDSFPDSRRHHMDSNSDDRRPHSDILTDSKGPPDSRPEGRRPPLDPVYARQENRGMDENFDGPPPPRNKRDPLIREPRNSGPLLDRAEPPAKIPRGMPSLTVEVRSLPFDACDADVLELFRGIFIPPENIKLVHDGRGKPAGNAFVKFLNQRDYEEGLSRNQQYIGNSCPEVIPCPASVFENAPGPNSQINKGKGPLVNKRKPPIAREEDLIVELDGLPYSCKDDDIVHFFDGLRILDIYIERSPNGRASGTGFVEFGTPEDLQASIKMDRKMIGHRYITISISSKQSMLAARGDFGPPPNEPPFEKRPGRERGPAPHPSDERAPRGGPPGGKTTFCVSLNGLPGTVSNGDIADFFSSVKIIPHAIHIMLDPNKVPTGEAFAEFCTIKELEAALLQNKKMLSGAPVSILPIAYWEMVDILGCPPPGPGPLPPPPPPPLLKNPPEEERSGRRPLIDFPLRPGDANAMGEPMHLDKGDPDSGPEPFLPGRSRPPFEPTEPLVGGRPPFSRMRGSGGPPRGSGRPRPFGPERPPRVSAPFRGRGPRPPAMSQHMDSGPQNFGAPGCVVAISNLHFNAGLEDLLDLFCGYSLNKDDIIRKYNELGQVTGEARVAFHCPEDARRAVDELNRKQILGRSIMLSLV